MSFLSRTLVCLVLCTPPIFGASLNELRRMLADWKKPPADTTVWASWDLQNAFRADAIELQARFGREARQELGELLLEAAATGYDLTNGLFAKETRYLIEPNTVYLLLEKDTKDAIPRLLLPRIRARGWPTQGLGLEHVTTADQLELAMVMIQSSYSWNLPPFAIFAEMKERRQYDLAMQYIARGVSDPIRWAIKNAPHVPELPPRTGRRELNLLWALLADYRYLSTREGWEATRESLQFSREVRVLTRKLREAERDELSILAMAGGSTTARVREGIACWSWKRKVLLPATDSSRLAKAGTKPELLRAAVAPLLGAHGYWDALKHIQNPAQAAMAAHLCLQGYDPSYVALHFLMYPQDVDLAMAMLASWYEWRSPLFGQLATARTMPDLAAVAEKTNERCSYLLADQN